MLTADSLTHDPPPGPVVRSRREREPHGWRYDPMSVLPAFGMLAVIGGLIWLASPRFNCPIAETEVDAPPENLANQRCELRLCVL